MSCAESLEGIIVSRHNNRNMFVEEIVLLNSLCWKNLLVVDIESDFNRFFKIVAIQGLY